MSVQELESEIERLSKPELAAFAHWFEKFVANGSKHTSAAPKARVIHQGADILLEAPDGAPPMTAENVKQILQDWP